MTDTPPTPTPAPDGPDGRDAHTDRISGTLAQAAAEHGPALIAVARTLVDSVGVTAAHRVWSVIGHLVITEATRADEEVTHGL